MNQSIILEKTRDFVFQKMKGESSGHDWWHVYRVNKTALYIAKKENADLFVVELAALLHDIADWKFYNGDESVGLKISQDFLSQENVSQDIINHVCEIIAEISFKGAGEKNKMKTIEGKVVQDADRLDAMGALGIARTFAYGGYKGREIYNPNIDPQYCSNFEEYKNNDGPSLNHFYEKLLLLKERMNTCTGKELAEKRHTFMELYLSQFFQEWEL